MSLTAFSRNQIRKLLTKESNMVLMNRLPSRQDLEHKFHSIDEFGLYLHIPFCRQICPYCPYNKEIYKPEAAESYSRAILKEIDFYSGLLA
ncbi:MAG: oxygen-independent coproporphyrinogen oxidase, partial [Chloroflexi bacterium]|nr:oxygen-independent coproporphyrinogen oxidase [Chloroflexota bacterium]